MFAVASAACAVAASPGALIAARAVQGAAAAAMIPAALALLLAAFPPQKWAAAIAAWGAVSAVAAALGPPLGGLLVEAGSWRWIFVINVPVGLITVWLGMRRLRESRAAETAPPDLPGAVLLAGATGALALALVQGETWGWGSAATLGSFAAALVIGGAAGGAHAPDRGAGARAGAAAHALGARGQRRDDGVRRRAVRRQPVRGPVRDERLGLDGARDRDRRRAGRARLGGGGAARRPLGDAQRPAAGRGGRRRAVRGLAAWVVVAAGEEPNFFGVWLPYGLVGGVGIGLGLPALIGATAAGLPAARFATGMALATTARQLGAVLGVALLVAVIGTPAPDDALAAFDAGFALCAIAVTLAAVSALLLGPRPEPAAATAPVSRGVRTASSSA